MEGFTGQHLTSSNDELSSVIHDKDQSRNIAVANICTTNGFENTTPPLDSQLSHASSASSAHFFPGDLPSTGTSVTSGSHRFVNETRMTIENFRDTASADALSQHRQDTTSLVPCPVWTNLGVWPHQQQPINVIGFQQNSLHNMAAAYDAVQLGGMHPLTSYLKDTKNMQGNRDAAFDLNISAMAMKSSGDSKAVPQAAVVDYGHSKIQPLGHQTSDNGSEQQNVVTSNHDTSKNGRNFDRRFMVLQNRTAAEGYSMPISGSHVGTDYPHWGHAAMDVSRLGQHTPGGVASLGNNLDGQSLFNYDARAYNRMLLNNIHTDSGNMRYDVAVTPSLMSPLINQLQPGIYPQAWLNQKPCSSSPMCRRRVRMASPASIRQPMQMSCNFPDLSSATGSVFPGITGPAGEGRASMKPYTSIPKCDSARIPTHKRKVHPPTDMGDVISRKTQPNAYAVNFSQAQVVPPTTGQYMVGLQISQLPPYSATGPGSVRISMPTPKQEQVVPPQFKSAMPRPETPICFFPPAPIVSPPMTQQQIVAPSSSTRRRPICPLHGSNTPGPCGKYSPPAAPKPERSKISPVICFETQRGLDQPLGYNCGICKRDVSYSPEGPITVPTAPLTVAVLACGHTFHDQCLLAITPKEQQKDPPCIPCAMRDD